MSGRRYSLVDPVSGSEIPLDDRDFLNDTTFDYDIDESPRPVTPAIDDYELPGNSENQMYLSLTATPNYFPLAILLLLVRLAKEGRYV
jgi:hypothetical protein